MNCHLENNIRQINHTSLICFAMLEKNRINRNFGFLLSVFGFYRLCQHRLRFRFRLLKKPRFSVSVSVTDPALVRSTQGNPLICLLRRGYPLEPVMESRPFFRDRAETETFRKKSRAEPR